MIKIYTGDEFAREVLMVEESFLEKKEESIAMNVFAVSAALVGVCFTVIGLISVIHSFSKIDTWADEITILDAILFLCACFFLTRRSKQKKEDCAFSWREPPISFSW